MQCLRSAARLSNRLSLHCSLFVLACAPAVTASAQSYPTKPVRAVVAFAAGGLTDGVARLVGLKLSERLGQPVVIDNRGGAGGNLGAKLVAAAPADGYTLLVTTAAIAINVSLYKNPGFGFKDFVPVANTASTPGLFAVHASNRAGTLQDLIRSAKATGLNYATAGVGSSSHLAGDYLFRSLAGLQATHVPFKGGAPAISAVLAQEVEVLSLSMPPVVPHVKAGRLKGLAISSLKRVAALPNVPTVSESGFANFEERSWVGYFAPGGTPAAIVKRLNAEVSEVLRMPDVVARLDSLGLEPQPLAPKAFSDYVRAEVAKWEKIIKTTGITAD
jgi:tripartite-type tricarboxylate transporter receptor subunit TctC